MVGFGGAVGPVPREPPAPGARIGLAGAFGARRCESRRPIGVELPGAVEHGQHGLAIGAEKQRRRKLLDHRHRHGANVAGAGKRASADALHVLVGGRIDQLHPPQPSRPTRRDRALGRTVDHDPGRAAAGRADGQARGRRGHRAVVAGRLVDEALQIRGCAASALRPGPIWKPRWIGGL